MKKETHKKPEGYYFVLHKPDKYLGKNTFMRL